jgi:hypothetical protein
MSSLRDEICETCVEPGRIACWWLGQEGFALKTREATVYIDPYLSDYAERVTRGKANEHIRMTPAPMQPSVAASPVPSAGGCACHVVGDEHRTGSNSHAARR